MWAECRHKSLAGAEARESLGGSDGGTCLLGSKGRGAESSGGTCSQAAKTEERRRAVYNMRKTRHKTIKICMTLSVY